MGRVRSSRRGGGRPPSRWWRWLRPVVLSLAALLAALGIPIILRDPARLGQRTAEVHRGTTTPIEGALASAAARSMR
ncbi:MAG: hypothetical protein U0V56_01180 [Actinomycetota bacterium]